MKRTLSGELSPTPLPVQAGAPTGAEQDNTALPPAAPDVHTHEPDQDILADWMNAANEALPDLNSLLQQMPHTPPILSPRDGEDSVEEFGEINVINVTRSFEEVYGPFLNQTHENPIFILGRFDYYNAWALSPEQRQKVARAIGTNSILKTLSIRQRHTEGLLDAVAEGMATNTQIETLILKSSCPAGSGALLAAILRSNQHLKILDISGCSELTAEDMHAVFDALQVNCTLTYLNTSEDEDDNRFTCGKELIQKLGANRGLKTLYLPGKLTLAGIEALGGVLEIHPSLTCLGLGYLLPHALTGAALGCALEKAARITAIDVDFFSTVPDFDGAKYLADPDYEDCFFDANRAALQSAMDGIGKCPALSSMFFRNVLMDSDGLIAFMEANPKIIELCLSEDRDKILYKLADDLKKILAFSRSTSQLVSFAFEKCIDDQGFMDDEEFAVMQEIRSQTALNFANLAQAKDAGMGMSVMLDVQAYEPEALPVLPPEITLQLADAVLQNLTPADAKTVFDTVAPYAQFTLKGKENKV